MFDQILTIVSIALVAIPAIIFIIRGATRGIVKALMTAGNIALSAFLSCFLSRDFTTIARDYIYPLFIWVMSLFGISLEEYIAEFEEIIALLPLFVGVILTPVLFLACFFIFRTMIGFILAFFHRPKRKTTNEEGETVKVKRHVPVWSRICGGLLGVVSAFMIANVVALPVIGYAELVGNVSVVYFEGTDTSEFSREESTLPNFNNGTIYFMVEDYVKPINENWLAKTGYAALGRPMFRHMTATAYDNEEFQLEREAIAAIRLVKKGAALAENGFDNVNGDSVTQLHELVSVLDDSVLMPELAASLISNLCENWANGQALFGMEKPSFGELLDPTVDVLLDLLATMDRHVLVADLNTLLDVLDMMVDYKIFENLGDSNSLTDILSNNPDMIDNVMETFEKNEHLKPMVSEIKRLCVRAITQSLDMNDTELVGTLTQSINAHKDQPDELSKDLTGIIQGYLNDNNIETTVSTEMTDEVAEAISKEFADQESVSEDEVIDFVLNYASNNLTDGNGNIDLDGDGIPDGNVGDVNPDDITLPE